MKTIFLVAADSIRSLLHQRLLLGLMLASIALSVFFSVCMSKARTSISVSFSDDQTSSNAVTSQMKMSKEEKQKFDEEMDSASSEIQASYYGIASFGGSLVSLFIFSTAVASEIRKGTIRLTLSKPVSRTQFLLGKYLGGIAVMAGYAFITSASILIFAQSQSVDLSPAIKWAPWLMFCLELMLGSLAMLLSLFMHPFIASLIAYFAGNGFYSLHNPLYYILPGYQDFNIFIEVLKGTIINLKDVTFLSLYSLDFVIMMLLLALWRFRTKELV